MDIPCFNSFAAIGAVFFFILQNKVLDIYPCNIKIDQVQENNRGLQIFRI